MRFLAPVIIARCIVGWGWRLPALTLGIVLNRGMPETTAPFCCGTVRKLCHLIHTFRKSAMWSCLIKQGNTQMATLKCMTVISGFRILCNRVFLHIEM